MAKFYDLYVKRIDSEILDTLKKFGYSGICLVKEINLDKEKVDLKPLKQIQNDLDVHQGVSLEAKNFGKIRKFVRKYRKKLGLIYAPIRFWKKGSQELIDAFTLDGELEPRIARVIKEKEIGVELSIKDFLGTSGLKRAGLLNKLIKAIRILNKYQIKVVCTSRAENVYDLRAPKDMASVLGVLGLEGALNSVSKNCDFLLKRSKKIRDSKTPMPGVRIK